jgi:hypothetical protein
LDCIASLAVVYPVTSSEIMEASTLVKFFAAAGIGYVAVLGTLAGAIPPTIAAAGLAAAWLVGRNATS